MHTVYCTVVLYHPRSRHRTIAAKPPIARRAPAWQSLATRPFARARMHARGARAPGQTSSQCVLYVWRRGGVAPFDGDDARPRPLQRAAPGRPVCSSRPPNRSRARPPGCGRWGPPGPRRWARRGLARIAIKNEGPRVPSDGARAPVGRHKRRAPATGTQRRGGGARSAVGVGRPPQPSAHDAPTGRRAPPGAAAAGLERRVRQPPA